MRAEAEDMLTTAPCFLASMSGSTRRVIHVTCKGYGREVGFRVMVRVTGRLRVRKGVGLGFGLAFV